MANFSEKQIQEMINALKWEYGFDNNTRELALLELEDLVRKGCTLEHIGECHGCSASTKENNYCPLCDWEKRHPEYANDELATKIKILEAGGEEAYKEKMKLQDELCKKASDELAMKIKVLENGGEEAQKATDADRAEACRHLLDLFRKSKLTATEGGVLDLIENILNAKTKVEIWDEVAKTA